MGTRNIHSWKSTTPEGEKREMRAEKFAARWRIQVQIKGEDTWSYYDRPPIADLMELREVLWRKYQRKKLPWEDLVTIDRLISEAQGRE